MISFTQQPTARGLPGRRGAQNRERSCWRSKLAARPCLTSLWFRSVPTTAHCCMQVPQTRLRCTNLTGRQDSHSCCSHSLGLHCQDLLRMDDQQQPWLPAPDLPSHWRPAKETRNVQLASWQLAPASWQLAPACWQPASSSQPLEKRPKPQSVAHCLLMPFAKGAKVGLGLVICFIASFSVFHCLSSFLVFHCLFILKHSRRSGRHDAHRFCNICGAHCRATQRVPAPF